MSQAGIISTSAAGAGDVVGPASSTDNAIVRWDGATGKLIQNSIVIISDTGIVSGWTGLRFAYRAVGVSDNIDNTDFLIGATAGPITLTLTAGSYVTGQSFVIKDQTGNAGANAITIDTDGAETIDGAATATINTNFGSISIYFDGTNYFIF